MRVDVDDMIAEGEKVVHRFMFFGTHKGEFLGAGLLRQADACFSENQNDTTRRVAGFLLDDLGRPSSH